jgi:hypothetical protein
MRRNTPESILDRIEQDEEGCWTGPWRPSGGEGYRQVRIGGTAQMLHRVVYEALEGPIPDGLTLDHLCRNRACCNPGHLEPVTMRENTLRGDTIPAQHAAKDSCPKCGGEFSVDDRGWRSCKPCKNAGARARWARGLRSPGRSA